MSDKIKMIRCDIYKSDLKKHFPKFINPEHIVSAVNLTGQFGIELVNGERGFISAFDFNENFQFEERNVGK